ncbi:MAG: glycoside hydrolase family 32 protein [Firmicutes bacterium]|nr:glycoside hydrolase family 32 protein [Bacillota bacterium]
MPERLRHHFEPRFGWMNDPNGLCFYEDQVHAFFQQNPYGPIWGAMYWGHAVSDDLLHWEEQPLALVPDQWYENRGGCWSGSAVVHGDELYLFYTGVSDDLGQTVCVARSGDGRYFQKHRDNPVIRRSPDGSADFRDPKVTKIGDTYYMVVGSGSGGVGRVQLYRSEKLLDWRYAGVLLEGEQYGRVIECPDFFPLGDGFVLMFSQMDRPANLRSTMFVHGDFDGAAFTPRGEYTPAIGPHFYAPQSFQDDKGRRVVIGWLYSWSKPLDEGADYAGALSIPLELKWAQGRLTLFPVEEARHLLCSDDPLVATGPGFVEIASDYEQPLRWQGPLRRVDILRDTKTIEVFINGGEAVFSYWFGR